MTAALHRRLRAVEEVVAADTDERMVSAIVLIFLRAPGDNTRPAALRDARGRVWYRESAEGYKSFVDRVSAALRVEGAAGLLMLSEVAPE